MADQIDKKEKKNKAAAKPTKSYGRCLVTDQDGTRCDRDAGPRGLCRNHTQLAYKLIKSGATDPQTGEKISWEYLEQRQRAIKPVRRSTSEGKNFFLGLNPNTSEASVQ